MSAASGTVDTERARPAEAIAGWAQRNAWNLGLLASLVVLLVFTRLIQPSYGAPGVQGLAISVLPLALAAVAQAIVVIVGRDRPVDRLDDGADRTSSPPSSCRASREEFGVVVVVGVLLLGLVLGAINGSLIVLTRVPDIVVTLAMSFVWAGFALLVLPTPGRRLGEVAARSRRRVARQRVDPEGGGRARSSSSRSSGSRSAARRSGCRCTRSAATGWRRSGAASRSVGRRSLAYALTGPVRRARRPGADREHRASARPVPGPYTLLSVAAVVLGGVSLAGGRGGVFGPILAVIILQLIRTDMTFLNVNTNLATVAPGRDPDRRGHARQPGPDPGERGDDRVAGTANERSPLADRPWLAGALPRPADRSRCSACSPSSSSSATSSARGSWVAEWVGVILRAAVPLAILAGCQTLTMLTGGIDLSVGAVASMAGFVVASFVGRRRDAGGDRRRARSPRRWPGSSTAIGVGVFRVHPLIMTLGMSLVVLGLANVWQLQSVADRRRASRRASARSGRGRRSASCRTASSSSSRSPRSSCSACGGPATAGCSMRSATTRSRRACRAPGRGRSWSCCTSSRRCWPRSPGSSSRATRTSPACRSWTRAVLPSVAAAVIGGTSILGGRGGYGGTIVGALILTVLSVAALVARLPGGRPPDPVRGDHRPRRGRLHARHRRDLTDACGAAA